jgi:transcriptional pleiotropic repressor
VSFDELCVLISEMLESNVYILSKSGKLLSAKYSPGEEAPLELDDSGKVRLPQVYNDRFLAVKDTRPNLIYDSIKEFYGKEYEMASKYHLIVPIIFGGNRLATLLLARPEHAYDDEDIAICEYGATVIGLEVAKGKTLEEEADSRERNAVSMALETLSFSELDAVTKIFAELEGDEGLLVASKIADKSGITRSVIVNALRKLESAGVIESRSLGMKGTRIKITNEFLREEINKIDI